MIYAFLVDTSVSMNAPFSDSFSYIDAAKAAIEIFFKWELRNTNHSNNRYLLRTYGKDDVPSVTQNPHEVLEKVRGLNAWDHSDAGGIRHLS
jgi:hypothetical protein